MQYKHNKIILLFTTIFIIIELILIYSTSIVSSNLGYNIIILSNLIPFISMMFLKSKKIRQDPFDGFCLILNDFFNLTSLSMLRLSIVLILTIF
ncbi:hypothetical protein [Staphylococcus pasteuri]|nr:hypothetical protein [Staphylococcus pasteuri]